jgi:hypothetical protein
MIRGRMAYLSPRSNADGIPQKAELKMAKIVLPIPLISQTIREIRGIGRRIQ